MGYPDHISAVTLRKRHHGTALPKNTVGKTMTGCCHLLRRDAWEVRMGRRMTDWSYSPGFGVFRQYGIYHAYWQKT